MTRLITLEDPTTGNVWHVGTVRTKDDAEKARGRLKRELVRKGNGHIKVRVRKV